MSSIETTAKEKEFSYNIFYLLIFSSVILIFVDTIWKFQSTIYQTFGEKLKKGFIFLINILHKIQGESNFLDSSLIHCFLLLLFVFICMVSQNKVNLKANKTTANLYIVIGFLLWIIPFFITSLLLSWQIMGFFLNIALYLISMIMIIKGGLQFNAIVEMPENDLFNDLNEQFPQNAKNLENDFSVGFKTQYMFKNEWKEGFIPVVSPQRAVLVAGSQGSGKTFSVLIPAMWQSIYKGYCGVIYDFKFPDLSIEAYNALIKSVSNNQRVFTTDSNKEPIIPTFVVIDFEHLKYSNRCNPFHQNYMNSIDDTAQLAKTLLYNINKTWIKKEGDFWVISAINYLTCAIWFLKLMENEYQQLGEICDLPHAIELINKDPNTVFSIIERYPELDTYSSMFTLALRSQASKQISGQIATIQASLAGLSSAKIYWVMSGNDTDLSVNDPNNPKIICLGNTPTKSSVYGAALSVYTSTIMKMIYKHKQIKCSFFIDELPSMYLLGLDDFIATVRSYKIATWLGIQDIEQLTKSYGQEAANVIINTCGTIFSGSVNAKTAETFSKMFGKTNQNNVNTSLNKADINLNYGTNMQDLVPASKIMTLSQGDFIGKVADNFEQPIDLKLFKAFINVESEEMKKETNELPLKFDGTDEELEQAVSANYLKIKEDIKKIIDYESSKLV
jgi:hypothetical protein